MATIYDIANKANVSPQTVSRVLANQKKENRPSSIARSEMIRKIALEMGYRSNTAAKAIAKGRFNCVGLLRGTGQYSSKIPVPMLDGMQRALASRTMHLAMTTLADEDLTCPDVLPKILDTQMCDGLLVDYTDHVPEGLDRLISQHEIPAVWVNRKLPRDAVYADEVSGAESATCYLLDCGHRHITYIDLSHPREGLESVHYSVVDREAGYTQAMRASGLEVDVWRPDRFVAAPDRVAWIRARLESSPKPQAFVAYGDRTTHPLAHVLAIHEAGSGDCADVIDFRQRQDVWHAYPSYWHEPAFEVGRRAVDLLVERIASDRPLPADPVAGTACFATDPVSR